MRIDPQFIALAFTFSMLFTYVSMKIRNLLMDTAVEGVERGYITVEDTR